MILAVACLAVQLPVSHAEDLTSYLPISSVTPGATVVGMTGCPEVTLAKEANLRYAAIALVVNPAAGVSDQPITMEDISACLKQATVKVIQIIDAAITEI